MKGSTVCAKLVSASFNVEEILKFRSQGDAKLVVVV